MKNILEITDEGYEALLGERVTFYCGIYIYCGKVAAIADQFIRLEDAEIVYNTGPHDTPVWEDAKPMPHDWNVQIAAIESFGIFK